MLLCCCYFSQYQCIWLQENKDIVVLIYVKRYFIVNNIHTIVIRSKYRYTKYRYTKYRYTKYGYTKYRYRYAKYRYTKYGYTKYRYRYTKYRYTEYINII